MLPQQKIYPFFENFDEEECRRYLVRLKQGEFLEEISYEDAINYFKYKVASDSIIEFALAYLKSQVYSKFPTKYVRITDNYAAEIKSILSDQKTLFYVMLYNENRDNQQWLAMIWNSNSGQLLVVNDKPEITKMFKAQNIINHTIQNRDVLSAILYTFIQYLNAGDLTLKLPPQIIKQSRLFFRWVIVKYHHMQTKGMEQSNLLDDLKESKEIHYSNHSLISKHETKKTTQKDTQPKNTSKRSIQQLPPQQSRISFNLTKHSIPYDQQQQQYQSQLQSQSKSYISQSYISQGNLVGTKSYQSIKQLEQSDVQQILDGVKQDILNEDLQQQSQRFSIKDYGSRHFLDHLPTQYNSQNINKGFKIRLDDLQQMMKDEINQNQQFQQQDQQNAYQELQYLLNYYSQHNPYQYQVLLNQYQDIIHQQLFEGMGLRLPAIKQPQYQPSFNTQQQNVTQKSLPQINRKQSQFNLYQ